MKRLTARHLSKQLLRGCGCVGVSVICVLGAFFRGYAQDAQFTQNMGGSHAMTLQVPLANYPGRGAALPVNLNYSTVGLWRIGFINAVPMGSSVWRSVTEAIYAEHSTAGWTTSLDVPKVEWPKQNDVYWYTGKSYPRGTISPFTYRVAQLFIHLPDGSIHEMRKADAVYQDNGTIDMVGTFYAVDTSRMRYDSTGQNTGTLYLADGSRYILSSSTVQHIDKNGNTLNYNVSTRQWTDTLGRVIGMPWPMNPGPGNYLYSLPGFNGSTIEYTLKFQSLSATLTPDAQGQTPTLEAMGDYYLPNPNSAPTGPGGSNFPQTTSGATLFISGYSDLEETTSSYTYVVGRGQSGSSVFNPTVLAEIVMPNGQSYKFSYSIHGELTKVIYPTGGYQRYQHSEVIAVGVGTFPYRQGSRGMISRWLSPNGTGGPDEAQWQYSASINPMTITAPDGTSTEIYMFVPSLSTNNFGYRDGRQSLVTEERVFQGTTMLRRTLYHYGQTTSINNKPVPPNTINPGTYTAYRNPRLEKTVNLVLDTGGDALAKTLTYEYIDNGYQFSTGLDRNASNQFHFVSVDPTSAQSGLIAAIPSGSFASRAETIYLDVASYRARNILGLPTSVIIKDAASQIVSRAESDYDETEYPLITYGDLTGADYIDPGTNVRGNVTSNRRYVDIGANTYLETHAQFDQCGNLRVAWNARGIDSQTQYSSTYKHAYATSVTTAAPDPTGAHGSTSAFTTSGTFDYTSGSVLTTTDVNGQVTSFGYQNDAGVTDPLNRLRKVTRPDGGWTKTAYGETPGNLFILTETRLDNTRSVKAYQYFDPMGRVTRDFSGEGAANYIAIDTFYDQMGRVSKTSNPYRTTTLNGVPDLAHTNDWTTTQYDALNRVVMVTMPDASTLQTSYQGAYATLTDQAGRQRRQKTDALGRIVRVDEPNSSGSLGTVDAPTQPTYYDYDTQGNVIHVAQGSSPVQHRYFKYDAIGRLTYERQVEQAGTFSAADPLTGNGAWSRKLVYDETIGGVTYQGLLTTSHDARSVQAQFRYDKLNRIYQVNYSDGTPTVNNNYDQQRTGYFNLGHVTEAVTAAAGSIPVTRQLYDHNLMGKVVHQQQEVGTESYSLSYQYNLRGVLTSQTYPSGRVVNYAYDDAARLSQVSSGATNYASQYNYSSSSGMLQSLTMGNGAVESYAYNSRLQLQSLDLTRSGTQIQHYDYKYGVYDPVGNTVDETKNNGQVAQIEGFIGAQKQWQQRFAYDRLGRLASAREFRGDNGQRSYLVNYEYDVFGNRYQKQTQNIDNPFAQEWVESGDFDQATNRFNAGLTYDNSGNITVDSRFRDRQLQYDANSRQKQSANLDGSGAVVNVYDAGGQRVGIQVGGSLTSVLVYDTMSKLVAEYNSTTVQGGTQYVFSDYQGTPRAITSTSGTVISRHDYLAFGEELGTVGMRTSGQGYGAADAARQKYAGMETDTATGMAHTLWRQYESYSGRWTAPDPYGGSMDVKDPQSFNRYTYVNNNPVNAVDPLGLAQMDIISAEQRHDAYINDTRSLRVFHDAFIPGERRGCLTMLAANPTLDYEDSSSNNPNGDEESEDQDPSEGSTGGAGSTIAHELLHQQEAPTAPPIDPCDPRLLVTLDRDVQVAPWARAKLLFSPEVAGRLNAAIRELNAQGITPIVAAGFRTAADQQRLQGRPRGALPAAAVGLSRHQSGNAIDISQDTPHFRDIVVPTMRRHGFEWGGTWQGEQNDPPHFEITPVEMRPRGGDPETRARFVRLHREAAARAESFFNQCFVHIR